MWQNRGRPDEPALRAGQAICELGALNAFAPAVELPTRPSGATRDGP